MKINFKRLEKVVSFLACNAGLSADDVVIVYCEPYIRLVVVNGDVEHSCQILGDQITYHTKQYVKI